MRYNKIMINNIIKIVGALSFVIFVVFFGIGVLNITPSFKNQISVTGTAKKDFSNQIAEFTIIFNSENKEKSIAEENNNKKVKKFLEDVKAFGISESDITTDNLNVYQKQENYTEIGVYKTKLTDWVYSQSIRIKIKDVNKVNDFTNLASKNEISSIYGPNFTVDTKSIDENEVYSLAIENARKKAEGMAQISGRTLGKALYITEGYNSPTPIPMFSKLGVGGAETSSQLPSGSTEISKTVSVIFELK